MRIFVLAALAFGIAIHAQTAKVIALSPVEVKQAQALDAEQKELTARKVAFDEAIRVKYLKAPKEDEGHTYASGYGTPGFMWIRSGWGQGEFQFSEDWKYIVPAPLTVNATSMNSCGAFLTMNPF